MKSNALRKKNRMTPMEDNEPEQPCAEPQIATAQKVHRRGRPRVCADRQQHDSSLTYVQDHLETEISKKVEELVGEGNIDLEPPMDIDWSEEATAQRIYEFTTKTFSLWREQHSEMDNEELLDSFEQSIRNAIDEGQSQTIDILGSMEVDARILESAEETVFLLHKMLDDYFTDLSAQMEEWEE